MEDPWSLTESVSVGLTVLFLIILSAFFCLFDHALSACRKPRLQKESQKGNKKYSRALAAAENPQAYLAAARTWIHILRTLAVFLAGFSAAGPVFQEARHLLPAGPLTLPLVIAVCTAALCLGVILLGELIPRLIARAAPEPVTAAMLPLIRLLALPLRPFHFLILRIGNFLRSALQLENLTQGITEDELRLALMEGEKSGIVESNERTMVEGVFYLGDKPVGAFMTHRSEIQWLDVNAPAEEIRAKALEYRSQRCFPVADGTLDEIIGTAYLEDIILDYAEDSPRGLRAVMKKVQFVPETMSALKAFESFKRGEANFLFVMDEYGGFAGIISVRDLMEEIVGELSGPGQKEDAILQQDDGSWLADGSMSFDEAAKTLSLPGLDTEHADYHTLAGFVLSLAGELPRTGESFAYQGFRFKVVDMDGNRIDKLLINREEDAKEGGPLS